MKNKKKKQKKYNKKHNNKQPFVYDRERARSWFDFIFIIQLPSYYNNNNQHMFSQLTIAREIILIFFLIYLPAFEIMEKNTPFFKIKKNFFFLFFLFMTSTHNINNNKKNNNNYNSHNENKHHYYRWLSV